MALAENLCRAIRAQEVIVDNDIIRYTLSAGVYSITETSLQNITEETVYSHLAAVDAKMYKAKQCGRDRVE